MGIWITHGTDAYGAPLAIQIEGDKIVQLTHEPVTPAQRAGHTHIDAGGRLLSAGFMDMHVHLREPGLSHKESIATGTLAAARGGFTTVACMPNTAPVLDDAAIVQQLQAKIAAEAHVRVLPYGCITIGQRGAVRTDFVALKAAGVIGFTDDGVGVQSSAMMQEAMVEAHHVDMPIVAHCEDDALAKPHGAAVTLGTYAQRHGLPGISNASEAIHIARDALLAEQTHVHYHVCHVSTEQSVRHIRLAKAHGVRITAEVCPHHLLLCDEDIPDVWDGAWKMNPPLRTKRDVEAMVAAVEDGTIDCIVTDHAPHATAEKSLPIGQAPFGIVGLETAFPLLYTHFVRTGRWTLSFLLERMTAIPARIFRQPTGRLAVGAPADLTIVDVQHPHPIDVNTFASKGRSSPFQGWSCYGWPVWTMVAGRVVWQDDAF